MHVRSILNTLKNKTRKIIGLTFSCRLQGFLTLYVFEETFKERLYKVNPKYQIRTLWYEFNHGLIEVYLMNDGLKRRLSHLLF